MSALEPYQRAPTDVIISAIHLLNLKTSHSKISAQGLPRLLERYERVIHGLEKSDHPDDLDLLAQLTTKYESLSSVFYRRVYGRIEDDA